MRPAARLVLALALASGARAQGSGERALGRSLLEPFGTHDVTLDGGALRTELDVAREFYLRIPNDDLLKGFRASAGKPAPGAELGGWYSADVFHVFGQILSGLARLYAASGDEACRAKVAALVAGWSACIEPDGYFYASRQPNAPHYIYDKLVGGLVDALTLCGVEEARGALARITGWAEQHLDRARRFNPGDGTEWYTLTENLDRAWLATGEPRYRDFAAVWTYDEFWKLFPAHADLFGPATGGRPYHAYSHVNTLGGAGSRYLVTGEARYLDILRAAGDELLAHHTFATGGFGPDEELLPPEQLAERLLATHASFETQCGSFAVLKLVKYLQRFTGEARWGDWAERVLVNGLLASLENADDGRVFYYSDYCAEGGVKVRHGTPWTCCSGTRPMALADACDLVWFRDADGLYANLFTPSSVRWELGGDVLTVVQETDFPAGERVSFTVHSARPVTFALRVRTPGWLAGPIEAELGGEQAAPAPGKLGWTEFRRRWSDGERLTLRFPRALRAVPLQAGHATPAAIACGPVVMAVRALDASPHAVIDLAHLADELEPCAGEALTFRLRGDADVLVRPFYAFREGEPYTLYLDPACARRIPHRRVTFTGEWADAGRFRYSNAVGATASCTFEGTGIRWLGYRFDDAGRARVAIDGVEVGVVDQYGPGRDLPFDWRCENLASGKHTLRLVLLEEKTEASRDRFLNVAGFEALGP